MTLGLKSLGSNDSRMNLDNSQDIE